MARHLDQLLFNIFDIIHQHLKPEINLINAVRVQQSEAGLTRPSASHSQALPDLDTDSRNSIQYQELSLHLVPI